MVLIKGCLWLTRGLRILEMKADSELAIGETLVIIIGKTSLTKLVAFTR